MGVIRLGGFSPLTTCSTRIHRQRFVFVDGRHVGLWRAAVVDVEVDVRFEPRFREPRARGPAGAESRALRLLVGDASGARSELSVPYDRRCEL